MTHAYVLVETLTLVSRRLGRAALERLLDALLPVVGVVAVDAPLHVAALAAYRDAAASNISFVDRTSFAFMRANRLDVAFAFDTDSSTAGSGWRADSRRPGDPTVAPSNPRRRAHAPLPRDCDVARGAP